MLPFRYQRPETLAEVVDLLVEHGGGARLLAGGTDLTVGLRQGTLRPDVVIDLKRVAELRPQVTEAAGALHVTSSVSMTDLVADARVQRHFPDLVEAAQVVGSRQIRNRATLAGNICNASPAADTAPVLALHGAQVKLFGPGGARRVAMADFVTGNRQTALKHGELVTGIVLPVPEGPAGAAFGRITRRRGVDLATVNVCCAIDGAGRVAVAFGAAAPWPVHVRDETGALATAGPWGPDQNAAVEAMVGHATPISDIRASAAYRTAMLKVLVRRTLDTARARRDHGNGHA